MDTLISTIESLRKKQYIYDFYVEDNFLKIKDSDECFGPEEVNIECIERYEGDSNPDDMSIIYGIASKSGVNGILLDAYGTYANPEISDFIKKVTVKEKDKY